MDSGRRSRFAVALGVLVLTVGLPLLTAVPAAAAVPASAASGASGSATVYVLQGLAGVDADVSVDGTSVATGVLAKTVVGPLRLPAGKHLVALSSKGTRFVSASVNVKAGTSVDVLGYWAAEAPTRPLMAVLPNDLSPVGAG